MVKYDIINTTNQNIKEIKKLHKIIKKTIKKEKLKKAIFNIVIVDNNEIKNINKKYRNINKETDVITFAFEDKLDNIKNDFRILGEIYISIDQAIIQKQLYNHSLLRELAFLCVHGMLHLLGYDHQNEKDEIIMKVKTEVILNESKIYRK